MSVRFESFVELLIPWAGQTLSTDVKVTRLAAREEVLLIRVDLPMAHVAVKLATIGLKRTAFHSSDLWIDEVSLLQRMRIPAANLGRFIL